MRTARNRLYLLVTADVRANLARLARDTQSPRQDFLELARALDAQILSFSDTGPAAPLLVRLVRRALGPATALAVLGALQRGTFYFTTAENTGFPLALLLKARRGVAHVMIGHRVTTPSKRRLMRMLRLADRLDTMLVYSQTQLNAVRSYQGLAEERVQRIAFQVDENFFTPGAGGAGCGVLSVGRELRDYPTLFAALEGNPVPATVVASSPWSKCADQTRQRAIPPNVRLRHDLTSPELRELYRTAAVVVVPLQAVDWAAGVTSLFEAQACGRPVIVSDSPGLRDSLTPGSVMTVPCGDAAALSKAIRHLLEHPDEASALGAAGRAAVLRERTLDIFVTRIAGICRAAQEAHQ